MSDRQHRREIDTLYAVRAWGIFAVVCNHAISGEFAGGLNLLFILSGMSFAQLCIFGEPRDFLRNTVRFLQPLVLGSLLLCLLWFAVFRRFDPLEIGMVSNWVATNRVSKFPIWYTQVLLQIMLVLVPLFLAFGLVKRFQARPLPWCTLALVLTVLLATLSKLVFDTGDLNDKLPHLHAWNFVLGWLFWVVLRHRSPVAWDRAILSVVTLGLMVFLFLGLGYPGGASRVLVAGIPVLVLLWVPRMPLPAVPAQVILLLSQSTLFLFFLHYPFALVVREVLEGRIGQGPLEVLQLIAGVVGPVLLWAVSVSALRTYREVRAVS